jgi:leucyl-tRNA synthetase
LCLSPFCPHISEELWSRLGHSDIVANAAWPEVDESALVQDNVTIAVQINGKLREKLDVPAGLPEGNLKEKVITLPGVSKRIEGREIVKVITVPDRLVNLVVK